MYWPTRAPPSLNRPQATAIAGRSALPLGVTAQQLQLGNLISSGAESSVYHGTYLGTRVAVKRPRIGTASDLDRFRRELCILASLQHDSIIPVLAAKALPPGATCLSTSQLPTPVSLWSPGSASVHYPHTRAHPHQSFNPHRLQSGASMVP